MCEVTLFTLSWSGCTLTHATKIYAAHEGGHVVHGLRTQDIEFIDIIQYDPRQMAAPPYRLRITTKLPSAGDRVCPHSITSKGLRCLRKQCS